MKIFIETDDDIRLQRRLKRDVNERGRTKESVVEQYHTTVLPMHQKYVEPSKSIADFTVNANYGIPADSFRSCMNKLQELLS